MTRGYAALVLYAAGLGFLSATGWRLHLGVLAIVSGLQGLWALGAWLSGCLQPDRPGAGAMAGGLFGLLALATYYLTEAVVDSVHSATSQLAASGRFWVAAAVVGGLVMGAVGTWARRPAGGRWVEPSALSHAVVAAALLAEAVFVHQVSDRFANPDDATWAVLVLVVLAALVVWVAWRRTGGRALVLAATLAAVLTPVAAGLFLLLEHRYGYLTL